MSSDSSMRQGKTRLGVALWAFVAFKAMGVLWNVVYIAFVQFWAMPRLTAADSGGGMVGDFAADQEVRVVEVLLTVIGLALLLRRSAYARRFWIAYLALFCVGEFLVLMLGDDASGALFYLVTGTGWLAYWVTGRKPRDLALSGVWQRPKD
ncbi:MAG: hypothetical protein JXO72_05290 [Vicinamibacteria bacterium]|nr:hypothetical protein [Vicinamibacteria bacterium]